MSSFNIVIKDLTLEVIIGILKDERENRQQIILNATIEYEKDKDFVDYVQVIDTVTKLLETKMYGTLEDALEEICKALKLDFPEIKSIKMSISKPKIFKNCLIGVEILKKY